MYKQISKNKRNSVFFMLGFGALFGTLGAVIGLIYNDYMISLWVLVGVVVYVFVQYHFSSKLAVIMTHAKPIVKADNPQLFRLVENLAITIGIPTPSIYIIEDYAPNAFAAGKNPEEAILGFTTGLLDNLDKQELEGVIAHEMGHIKNYDIRFKTIIFAMVTLVAVLVDIALRMFYSSGRAKNAAPFLIIGLVIIVVIWPISHLLKAAAGREREYLADATGAEITRYPEGLASALEKISSYEGLPLTTSNSTSMLFFDKPGKRRKQNWFTRLTSTHPPAEDRIKRLRSMGMEA